MQIIRGLHNIRPEHRGCVATIGNFDGVHHGHQLLLAHLNAKRDELGSPSVLITFEPLPREYFSADVKPGRLTRFREKVTLLARSSLDRMICLPFNEQVSQITAESVIEDFLVGQLGIHYIVVGDDFRFGRGRAGDYSMLQGAGDHFGFEVSHIGTLTFDHERVSSTRIREALGAGDIRLAEKLLGHSFFIMGHVMYGRQLGRQLGTPTANIALHRYPAPLEGVFAVRVNGLAREYQGVANIGVRPTVDGKQPMLEVHLFDFSGDLYGRLLTVTFCHKIRPERRFDSLDDLKVQISRDIDSARAWFSARASNAN